MKIESFKDLTVWQRSIELVKEVYQETANLPQSEIYGLTSQMRRCAVSIPSNIAEGKKRGTRKDYVHFLRIANGSAAELETQSIITKEIYKLNTSEIDSKLEEVQKMLSVMIKKLEQPKS
ncbi:MAG: four helix bundle protein [Candidatus Pacebacteria bacterium]|nr:four helix bundle protein [Candidatus Paceibacterota bacterium]